jgi:hypothetical protein
VQEFKNTWSHKRSTAAGPANTVVKEDCIVCHSKEICPPAKRILHFMGTGISIRNLTPGTDRGCDLDQLTGGCGKLFKQRHCAELQCNSIEPAGHLQTCPGSATLEIQARLYRSTIV